MWTATAPGISRALARLFRNAGQIAYALLTHSPLGSYCYVLARLACIRHSTSVRSEPGSNSSLYSKGLSRHAFSSVNSIDRSITQAHLQILQSAFPNLVRGVSRPFSTGTTPIIEIPTKTSRVFFSFFSFFRFFFAFNVKKHISPHLIHRKEHSINILRTIFCKKNSSFDHFFEKKQPFAPSTDSNSPA